MLIRYLYSTQSTIEIQYGIIRVLNLDGGLSAV